MQLRVVSILLMLSLLTLIQIARDGSIISYGNSFYTGSIPANPFVKPSHVDAITALKGVSKILSLPITASSASSTKPGSSERYIIKGSTGAHEDPKANLVYFQTPGKPLTLSWRIETNLKNNWLISYTDAAAASKVFGVVDWVSDAIYDV
jgi:extracellular elastinolytic metalloproteinase